MLLAQKGNTMKNIVDRSRFLKKIDLNPVDALILNSIEFKDGQNKKKLVEYIQRYMKLGLPMSLLAQNWPEIDKLGKDSSSLRAHELRYGPTLGLDKWKEKNKNCTVTKDDWIKKLGLEEATNKLSERGASLANYKKRHGEVEGLKKWNEYLVARAATYKKKKDDGHEYPKYNLDYFINLHGEENGTKIYKDKIETQRYKVSKQYYIDQYGEIDGPILCKAAKDNISLVSCIKRHGEEKGTKLHISYLDKQAKNRKVGFYASKWSLEVCNAISEQILDLFYFGKNELVIYCADSDLVQQRVVAPDLFYKGKIIEFNGDVFHANPQLYKEFDTPNPYSPNLTASDIWEKDEARLNFFKHKGYEAITIWESEWKTNKTLVINTCLNFLMGK